MNAGTREEEVGVAEITLSFLVSHLGWYDQNQFIQEMDRECFGWAEEGRYSTNPTHHLTERIPRTATFTFQVRLSKNGRISSAVADTIKDALDIAKKYKAYLLSASHSVKEDAA